MATSQNGKHPTTNSLREVVTKTLWDGRLVIQFAPSSVLQRAKTWDMVNEIKNEYPNQDDLKLLNNQLISFGLVMASVVDMKTSKKKGDNELMCAFLEWCDNWQSKPITDLFSELILMPPDFYDELVEAFNERPIYTPFEQRPAEKLPVEVLEDALDPKAS